MKARFLFGLFALFFVPALLCAQTILVLPLANSSAHARFDWVAEGLAHRSRLLLSGDGRMVIGYAEWAAAADRIGLPATTDAAGRLTRASMIRMAQELDADCVVFGSFSAADGLITLRAQVLRISPRGLSSPFTETSKDVELLDAHARLLWKVLNAINPELPVSQQDFFRRNPSPGLAAFELYTRALLAAEPGARVQLLLNAARQEPAWTEPAFELGRHFYDRRDCSTALIWLLRIPPANELGAEAAFYVGVCQLLNNDPARAEAAFVGIRDLARLPEVLNNLGVARARLARYAEAASLFRGAAQLDSSDHDYPFNLGLLLFRSDDFAAAISPLRSALALNPDDAHARVLLSSALDRTGQIPEAASIRDASSKPLPVVNSQTLKSFDRIKLQIDLSPLHSGPNDRNSSANDRRVSPANSTRPPGARP